MDSNYNLWHPIDQHYHNANWPALWHQLGLLADYHLEIGEVEWHECLRLCAIHHRAPTKEVRHMIRSPFTGHTHHMQHPADSYWQRCEDEWKWERFTKTVIRWHKDSPKLRQHLRWPGSHYATPKKAYQSLCVRYVEWAKYFPHLRENNNSDLFYSMSG